MSAAASTKKWTAVCRQCGPVLIVQKTKPTSCKTAIRVGAYSTRLCGHPLEQQAAAVAVSKEVS